jgi:uncharacterized protein (TIGR02300 family)
MHCGARFYDLNRDPATCPKCGAVNQVAAGVAPTRVAAPAMAARAPRVEEVEVEPAGPEIVSLEEVAASEAAPEATGDDIEIAEDVGTEDTFLEEEEESEDDVSGLIDGDIEDDEEA